ncbi:MAG TPA: Gfo/Idh/MocA family oxidoreductase [Lacipirellulaceae bacterium]|nr:Gfo/Idh/MocA family oxidoreductase [Lacipirellulaceae bacterium]
MSTRRTFLKHAAAGAALSAPLILTGRRTAAQQANGGDNALRIAAIGVGGSRGRYSQGGWIARAAAGHGQMIAVCDVDDVHTAEFNDSFGGGLAMYRDYRELLAKEKPDVVTIGTPDHWHIPIALAALRAGCHVYCEKPLTLTIDEGIAIREAVHASGKVFQVGTQQRSEYDRRFLQAIALVQSGRLGERVQAHVAIESGKVGGPFPSAASPEDLDWDMWVGPAPGADYSPERRAEFRWDFDYSGGKLTDWGAHHIDIAQWALGHDRSGPVKIEGQAKFPDLVPTGFDWLAYLNGEGTLPNGFHTAVNFHIDLEYADGATLSVNDYYRRDDQTRFQNGILFEGERGRIFVNRERLSGRPVEELADSDRRELDERIIDLCKGHDVVQQGGHMGNFFACIRQGGEPVADVDTHHRTMTTAHLCNIAMMLGRPLAWNPDEERFVDDAEAEAFRTRRQRTEFLAS